MSQAWLKVEKITIDKVEVAKMATMLKIDRYAVLGRLLQIWGYFDSHTVDGRIQGIDHDYLDGLVGKKGFCSAMASVGWLRRDESAVILPNFSRHNGKTAKDRALHGKRQQVHRNVGNDGKQPLGGTEKRHESDAPSDALSDATGSASASPEKRREEGEGEGEREGEACDQTNNYASIAAQEWCFSLARRFNGRPADSPEDAERLFKEWIRLGVNGENLLTEIRAAGRDHSEYLSQLKKRVFDPAGLKNGKPSLEGFVDGVRAGISGGKR
jgi:hypothetical protein